MAGERPQRARAFLTVMLAGLVAGAAAAQAGEADVVGVDVTVSADGRYSFDVAVRHDDEGWQHYADRWEVLGPDVAVLATRELAHPHENEQPFTRSLGGVELPADMTQVTVRAHDKVHDYGGATQTVDLPERN